MKVDSSTGAIWGLVVVNVATLATVVIRGIFAAATEKRHRQYDLEDRQALAAKVVATADLLAKKVDAHDKWERTEREATSGNHDEIVAAIAENTKISTDAFHEANTVNLKLEKLGLEHNAIDRVAAATKERHDDPK